MGSILNDDLVENGWKIAKAPKELQFIKIRDVKSPERGTSKSAGIDFFIPEDFEGYTLFSNKSIMIPSGIKVNIPEGFYLHAVNKGSMGTKGLVTGACIVDQDFQGEIFFDVHNISDDAHRLEPKMKVIQLILSPVEYCTLKELSSEEELYIGTKSERGEGALGSTNRIEGERGVKL